MQSLDAHGEHLGAFVGILSARVGVASKVLEMVFDGDFVVPFIGQRGRTKCAAWLPVLFLLLHFLLVLGLYRG